MQADSLIPQTGLSSQSHFWKSFQSLKKEVVEKTLISSVTNGNERSSSMIYDRQETLNFSTYDAGGKILQPSTTPQFFRTSQDPAGTVQPEKNLGAFSYEIIIKKRVTFLLLESFKAQQTSIGSGKETSKSSVNTHVDVMELYQSYSLKGAGINSLDFSPEATAQRILDFALSFYNGGDRTEYAAMAMKAVQKGFMKAAEALGGSLPEISIDTYNLVMKGFSEFITGQNPVIDSGSENWII